MKIAIVHNLPPGGQKRALYEQVKRLSKNHSLDLFTLSSTNESFLPLKPFIRKHIRVTYNPPSHFPKSVFSIYYDLPMVYKLLAEKVNEKDYDVVYVNPCYLTQAPYILKYLSIPSLYYCPEPKREFYEEIPHVSNRLSYLLTYPFRLQIKSIDKTNTRFATRILTNSRYSQERIDKIYGVSSMLNYLGVDTSLFKPVETEKENLVLTVGELSLHKGHDFIIRSLAVLSKKGRLKLIIVGHSGIEENYLVMLAKSLGVKLEIKTDISQEELILCYNKAKFFVYAPIKEPFGMVILEALSCGLPIVAVKEGGIPEIINKDRLGLLVERNEKEFGNAIKKVLGNPSTDEIRQRHDYVKKNWGWEKSVKELEKHLKEIVI